MLFNNELPLQMVSSKDIEGCIAHPEHMKRDNVICLSTSIGDTYYLQTTSQAEVDSWIRTIHSGMYV